MKFLGNLMEYYITTRVRKDYSLNVVSTPWPSGIYWQLDGILYHSQSIKLKDYSSNVVSTSL